MGMFDKGPFGPLGPTEEGFHKGDRSGLPGPTPKPENSDTGDAVRRQAHPEYRDVEEGPSLEAIVQAVDQVKNGEVTDLGAAIRQVAESTGVPVEAIQNALNEQSQERED